MSSQGPLSPGTVANDSSIGTNAWTNPSNAAAADDAYATVAVVGTPSVTNSQYLYCSNFQFGIPPGASIDGVTVEIQRFATGGIDRVVSLYVNGAVAGSNKASGAGWAAADPGTYVTYGGAADVWTLTTLTPRLVNARNFGCVLQAGSTDTGETVSVDHIRMTVTYTVGGVGSDLANQMTSFLAPASGDNTIVNLATTNFSRLLGLTLVADNTVTATLKDEAGTVFGTYFLVNAKPFRVPVLGNGDELFTFSGDLILNLSGAVNVTGNLSFKVIR